VPKSKKIICLFFMDNDALKSSYRKQYFAAFNKKSPVPICLEASVLFV